ncbi:uncharacterized protein AMSG_09606 [Thecamonas trahens ATCC 50062]|uniref:Uncharacterized protein n=1 Tax=Thecamonas trahens ATCC 50062 TaxID=461836 RepID=A0A0L0DNW6_THETB|nr:hypothetical protein AMSG_09606 [Thecamonas trahens ATCC 50062]KNC53960.1 hypothetical protein AMSG_09606 [Thecamonas trahens ATCC 50062]|eukprot:XP_013754162.1 hypothetical protein AMSG_09606 [Thecamonas trahens ATCC 50062]
MRSVSCRLPPASAAAHVTRQLVVAVLVFLLIAGTATANTFTASTGNVFAYETSLRANWQFGVLTDESPSASDFTSNLNAHGGFAFNIPLGYIIDGIKIDIPYSYESRCGISTARTTLVTLRNASAFGTSFFDSSPKTANRALLPNGPPPPPVSYGSSSDKWGLAAPQPALVDALNNGYLGVGIRIKGRAEDDRHAVVCIDTY